MFLIHESPHVHPTISKAEKAYIERNVDVHKVRLFVISHATERLIDCFVDRLIDMTFIENNVFITKLQW